MAEVASIEERIADSKKASAVVRAWEVAKSLETNSANLDNLKWVEPEKDPRKGITRKIDFSRDYPADVSYIQPTPMEISVIAPGNKLVPDEDIAVTWSMPLLSRVTESEKLDYKIQSKMGLAVGNPRMMPTIDVVSFLPFPKVGASEAENFNPEFYVILDIDADLGKAENYFTAVARYGDRIIPQLPITNNPNCVMVLADTGHDTCFSADMLVNLSQEELAVTPQDAGCLEIYVFRLAKGKRIQLDIGDLDLSPYKDMDFSPCQDLDLSSDTAGDRGARKTRPSDLSFSSFTSGYKELGASDQPKSYASPGLSSVPSMPRRPAPPVTPPSEVPKEIGDVRIGQGKKGEEMSTSPMVGYGYDKTFGVQRVNIRFLAVREGTEQQTQKALETIAQMYKN